MDNYKYPVANNISDAMKYLQKGSGVGMVVTGKAGLNKDDINKAIKMYIENQGYRVEPGFKFEWDIQDNVPNWVDVQIHAFGDNDD